MTGRLPWRHVAAVAFWGIASLGAAAHAQELVPQPHSEFLLVDVHSVSDEVQLRPGPLQDPPYLYRGWTRTQMVDLSPSGDFAMLRIWDRSLFQGGRREAEIWQIELMPAAPMALCIRGQGGKGKYDLSGMPLQSLTAFGFSGELHFTFDAPNPQRLETAWISLRDGELELTRFLQARPRTAVFRLSESSAHLDLGGQPFRGEAQLIFAGPAGGVDLLVPRDVGLHVEGAAEVLRDFEAPHMQVVGSALQSRGFDESPCRLRLLFEPTVTDVDVRWIQAGAVAPVGANESSARPADPLERNFERQLEEFLVLVAKGEQEAAVRKLRGLRDLKPGDGRLLFLETWLRERPTPEFDVVPVLGEADQRFREGLDFYVAGRYEEALQRFRAALAVTPDFEAARAWVRKTEADLRHRQETGASPASTPPPAPAPPPAPESAESGVIERVVTRTAAPVFALRSPRQSTTATRADRIEVSGQVGDDIGIDRIEVGVNGRPLLDRNGNRVTLLLPTTWDDSTKSLPFSVVVPLRPGRNEIVLTAYDRDATTHTTHEALVVVRQPAFFRTGAFLAVLGALVLVAAALTLLWRMRQSGAPRPGGQ